MRMRQRSFEIAPILKRIFALDCVVLYVHDQDDFHSTGTDLSELLKADLRELTVGRMHSLDSREGFEAQALLLGLRPVGALAWRPATCRVKWRPP